MPSGYHRIESVDAYKVLDSRANWTVQAVINGHTGTAPSGASTGTREARVIPPDRAVENIRKHLAPKLLGRILSQEAVDFILRDLDGTPNFSRIGGNTAVALSFAVYNALFAGRREDLLREKLVFPRPLGNAMGGGAHGGNLTIQEVLVLPHRARTYPGAIEDMITVYHELREHLKKKRLLLGINDEGALCSTLGDEETLELVSSVAEAHSCRIGVDVAATSFFDGKKYVYKDGKKFSQGDQIDYILELQKKYNLWYIEDPVHEDDVDGMREIHKKLSRKRVLVCGDDYYCTNPSLLRERLGTNNAIIIKPNQVGTITLALESVRLARENGMVPVVSHRSGETHDVTISRLCIEHEIPVIKAGIADMRVVKHNELLSLWHGATKHTLSKNRVW